jgi:subtilisin family serine protease
MNRFRSGMLSVVVAAGLAACGGGTDTSAPATPQATNGRATVQAALRMPGAPKVDARIARAKGPIDVWVQLDANSLARARALMANTTAGTKRAQGATAGEGSAVAAAMVAQRATVMAQQSATAQRLQALGAKELARVQVAHNAIAIQIDAARLPEIARLPGVVRVRPVMHYEKHLAETVPYVGAAAVQSGGIDGTGVRVAVLDSGIDYTHKNLGGSGSAADWAAASTDPTVIPVGLFPSAKVVGGYDFVGSTWSTTSNTRSEDPNPIDDGPERGHGTHVADIIAGRSLDGTHKGMAPGAQLYAVKVCSSVSTSCNGIAMLKGMDFALDPDGNPATDDAVDVVNLSLGSSYGQQEDDLTLAVSNAVAAGVVVVVSAGNSADRPYIVGSPSIAPGAISVAQTEVPGATAVPLLVNAPAAIAGVYGNTALLDWAPIGAGVTADVVFVGRGCAGDALLANPAGKIALIDRGTCNISEKVDKAANAGAVGTLIGLIAAGDAVSFSQGNGSNFVPSMVIQQSLANSIRSRLADGQTVNVTLSPSAAIALVGGMAGTSSRGPSIASHLIKPEIGAPGASVSANAGSGSGTSAFGGTSGAAPMVAGAAALLLQAHPGRSPLQVKAMLMNSAETTVYTNPATLPGGLAPITRIGAGELRVNRAMALSTAAWEQGSLSAALSFGAVEADKQVVLNKTITVQNFGNSARTFNITPSFRYADDAASGAVRVQVQGTVTVPAGGTASVPVQLVINPATLPSWELNGGGAGGNGALLNSPEYDGYLTFTAGSEKLSLPWHVLPRKAAAITGVRATGARAANQITLKNTGAAFGGYDYDVYSLIGTSAALPANAFPSAGDNFATIDMRSVGVRYLPPALCGGNCLEFAISNYGRRSHPNYPAGFEIYVDTNNDGTDDYVIFNQESGGFGASGQNRVYVASLAGGSGSSVFFTDADLNSGNLIFTVLLNADGLAGFPSLGAPTSATLGISVYAYDNYFTGSYTDAVEGMKFTPSSPKFRVSSGVPFGGVPKGPLLNVPFTKNAAVTAAQSSETGLLFMYRRNAGAESQAFVIP